MTPNDERDPAATADLNDPLVVEALQRYRASDREERGTLRRELLARFPQHAGLSAHLDDLDFFLAAATQGAPTLAAPPAADAPRDRALPQLGDFRLLREIGRGGMGVVYEAEQISLGRLVALKVLPLAAALDPRQLQRFKNEAQAAAHLHHQHIVPVHAVGHDRGVHFYAMQLIAGHSLATTLQELRHSAGLNPQEGEPLLRTGADTTPVETAPEARASTARTGRTATSAPLGRAHCDWTARLGTAAAEALEHAHSLGIVHRDIKPGNLLLDRDGHLWVTDFGVAQIRNDTRLTGTGDLIGTLRYMSPEQALGQRHRVDHRTDVYSLGATLFELLTLHGVFEATEQQELLRQIAWDEPPAPSWLNPAVPYDLDTIVLKALAKSPDERYATAQELADDLRRYLNNETIRARRPTLPQRLRKWTQRHKTLATATVVFALLLVLITLTGLGVSNVLISREKQQAVADRHRAKQAEFAARLAQARASRWSKRVGQRHATWAALQEAAALADELKLGEAERRELRDEAIGSLALPDLRPLKEIQAVGQDGTSTAMTADLERYSRSDSAGNLSIRRVEDDRELAVLPCTGYEGSRKAAVFQQFSPNGALLAVRHDQGNGARHNVRLWDWQRGKLLFEPAANFPWDSLDFSPDSRHLALGRPDGVLTLHDTVNGAETRRIVLGLRPTILAYHPDGSKLVVANQNTGEVQVRALPDGKLLRRWTAPHGICSLAWHPEGELLATGHHDYCVYLWDTRQGQARGTLRGHQGSVAGRLSFAPDGSTLLSSAWDGSCRLWDVWAQRELLRFSGMDGRFSLDGRRLAARRGHDLAVWEVTLSQECRPLPRSAAANRAGFHGGSVSPDGRWLALGTYQGAGLWDLARNQAAAFVPVGTVQDVQFHPSGEELFVSTQAGLAALPVTTERQRLTVGPLKVPLLTGNLCRLGLDRAGRVLAVSELHGAGVHLLDPHQRAPETRLLAHRGTTGAAVSPNGNWIASAVQHGEGIKVWEARTGQLLRHLFPDRRDLKSFFSPDSGELWIASTTAYTAWTVGDWEPVWEIRRETGTDGAGSAAFTRDGTILAVTLTQATIQLFDRSTRRPLGRLQANDTDRFNQLLFNADGSQLVSISGEGDAWIWDLRRLRERLAEIGLDWDQPPYPPVTVPPAMRVEVKLGWWPGLMP